MTNFNTNNLIFYEKENSELEKIIIKNGKKVEIKRGTIFKNEGDDLRDIFFIINGRTRHYMMDEMGMEKILYVLTKGWFFGESNLILDQVKTSLYSVAEVDTTIYIISNDIATHLIDTNKLFRDSVIQSFAYKTIILRNEIENLVFNSAKDRLKRFFCANVNLDEISDEEWININTKYTHYEIGLLVGSSRVTVTKMIANLAESNFLRIVNNRIQINKNEYFKFIES